MSNGSTSIVGSLPAAPGSRPCCLLIDSIAGTDILLDHSFDSTHIYGAGMNEYRTGREKSGTVYTCSLGFVDLGHLRDCVDLTWLYYAWIQRKHTAGDSFSPVRYGGAITISSTIPATDWAEVAASIAFDVALFHEIYSYYQITPGGHNSSFSPEDLVSNYLGTYVARKAIADLAAGLHGGDFNAAVKAHIDTLLTTLDTRPIASATTAYIAVRGTWVSGGYMDHDYLKRRNFDLSPVNPWLVMSLAECTQTTLPPDLDLTFSSTITGYYDFNLTVPWSARPTMGKSSVTKAGFAAEIAAIEADALATYGATYKTP